MNHDFEYDGELIDFLKNFKIMDLYEKLGEIFRPEEEREFEDELNF